MGGSPRDALVEVPREGMGAVARSIPDTPWTTTTLQALQTRRASVYADVPHNPRNLVIRVCGGDEPGDHDQVFLYGSPDSEALRDFVASVSRSTEFVSDEELAPMVLEIHPGATPREAVCFWFERLEIPAVESPSVPLRRLRADDSDAAQDLIPRWVFRNFATPKDMILGGACYAVELNGRIASIAYVVDKSVKYARVGAVTAERFRRNGFAFAAARKLIAHCMDDGRLVSAFAPRSNGPAIRLALKLGFTGKALLRTYKVVPNADQAPAPSAAAATHARD